MIYPIQVPRTYVNPAGNVIASGIYRSYLTQDLANDFPAWMHLRQNPRSVGQQLLASVAVNLEKAEIDLEYNMKSKFLNTAPVDEIDVLYTVKVPSNINLLDASASGVRCIAAPSGCSPSGVSQIYVQESASLEDFYYNNLPTGLEVESVSSYSDSIDGVYWNVKPSGILDRESKLFDVWKNRHDITWCYSDGMLRKQDLETMEDYETYTWDSSGTLSDMLFYKGMLWCIGSDAYGCYLTIESTKTQQPNQGTLDKLAVFDLTDAIDNPTTMYKIIVDSDGTLWISDSGKTVIYEIKPRYDYFTLDKLNRNIYFREDYRDSGVFVSNT
jgi:hypothetical protein